MFNFIFTKDIKPLSLFWHFWYLCLMVLTGYMPHNWYFCSLRCLRIFIYCLHYLLQCITVSKLWSIFSFWALLYIHQIHQPLLKFLLFLFDILFDIPTICTSNINDTQISFDIYTSIHHLKLDFNSDSVCTPLIFLIANNLNLLWIYFMASVMTLQSYLYQHVQHLVSLLVS